jgi:hypothetical protein
VTLEDGNELEATSTRWDLRMAEAEMGANAAAAPGIAGYLDRGPGPDVPVVFAEGFGRLIGTLTDPTLRAVALHRLEGRFIEEIADALHVAPRTVNRKLRGIRALWEREGHASDTPRLKPGACD